MDLVDLTPLATLVVGSVALFVGLRTIRQRDLADRREQWWERFRWAAALALGDDERQRDLGLEVLTLLVSSTLAGEEELEVLDAAMTAALLAHPGVLDDGWAEGDHGQDDRADDS